MRQRKRRETTEKRYRRLKDKYADAPPKTIRSGVLDCFFFNGLTDAQTENRDFADPEGSRPR